MYHFEGTLLNSITGAVNGTVTGTTTYTGGHEGQGFSFNGASYISIGNSGSLAFERNNIFNLSFWYKGNDADGTYLISKEDSAGVNRGYAVVIQGSGKVQFELINTNPTNLLQVRGSTAITDNNWHHIVITYSGSSAPSGVNIYVDGVLNTPSTISNTLSATILNSIKVQISGRNGANSLSTSIIDELRWYGTNVLTQAQVSALYEVGHYSQSHTFDGGEYVSTGTTGTFNFERTSPLSISTWVKTTATGGYQIIGKGNGAGGGANWSVYLGDITAGKITFEEESTSVTFIRVTGTTAINDGNWHYVAVTYDGSSLASGVKMYVDGLSDTTTTNIDTLSGTILNSNTPTIGARSDGVGAFIGQLDNTKLYPYALSSSQITSDYNSISPISSGKQYMSWYNGIVGSSTLTQKIGSTKSTLSLSCNLPTPLPYLVSNTTNIYYVCASSNIIHQINIQSGTDTTYFKIAIPTNGYNAGSNSYVLFKTIQNIVAFMADPSGAAARSATKSVNNTLTPTASSFSPISNQKLGMSGYEIKYNTNSSTLSNSGFTTNPCEINYTPTTTEKSLDNVACDIGLNPSAIKYWNGFNIQGSANYATNSTQTFLNSIDASSYKKLLSLPCLILVNENPCITFIATDFTNTDWLVVLTSTHVYYQNAQTANNYLLNHNYALQSYDIVTPTTTSAYEIQNPILQGISLYGFNVNTTLNKAGLFTLPSGYTVKTTTINSAVRTIDPRWTNDATDIPIITTTQSLFPIFLTVSNTPAFSAIKVTQGSQIINNMESVYAVAELDSTRSVEVDLVAGTCANVYIADISISPSIWNFQGIICATGVNQKTLAYTNTLPLSFFTLKYGVSESYVPSNNGLVTTFHTQSSPTTYNVLVKNSTGTVAINQTFTVPANQTIDTQSFNVSSVSKPAVLVVNVGGNQIYSSYLGSPLSLANVASFFHQYFNYQGFDFLSFIPIIFAAMFTRNTVGIGSALVVVLIATLSFLSVVTVPDTIIYMSIFIACISMVGYRGYQAYG